MGISSIRRVLLTVTLLTTCCQNSASPLSSFLNNVDSLFESENLSNYELNQRNKRQTSTIADESPYMYEVTSSSLPTSGSSTEINTRYLPTISNGHIGATIFEPQMYLNGLYNGAGGNSHRAAIPAMMMTKINLTTPEIDARAIRKYTLNARDGYFLETIDCEYAYIEHKMYMHQKYIRLFVSDIYVRMKPLAIGGGTLTMKYPTLESSDDVIFDEPRHYLGNLQVKGRTKEAEAGESPQTFYIFYMHPLTQISVSGSNVEANYTHIMSVDRNETNARAEFDRAQTIIQQDREVQGNHQLFMEHVDAWSRTWNYGHIEIQGDKQLAKTTWLAQYYILSSLPSSFPSLPPTDSEYYHGCSRTGLGKGGSGKDYQGHIMWDNEFYTFPAVLQFHPDLAKKMLGYRSSTLLKAQENAQKFGSEGLNYPWESASSGNEVTPQSCFPSDPQCNWRRIFVSAGVSWAIRQYYSVTRDKAYMTDPRYMGCKMSREIANFFAKQIVYSPNTTGRYELKNVTGPDDWHPNVNNNAFVNHAASLALHWARYTSCVCAEQAVPDEYLHKALYLQIPFDRVKRLHYQYDGFNRERDGPIKQADTIMLSYPLNWNHSLDIIQNDLEYYENYTDPHTPAMTWSWFTIGWKWVNNANKTRSYFLKSYQDYVAEPFKIWREYPEQTLANQNSSSVNFLPGMGAFLQSIVNGFVGVRIYTDKLEFYNPTLPPGATKVILHGLKYLGSNLKVTVEKDNVTVEVLEAASNRQLVLKENVAGAVESKLTTGAKIEISPARSGFSIYPAAKDTCERPLDYIFMPWEQGYTNGAIKPSQYNFTAALPLLGMAYLRTFL